MLFATVAVRRRRLVSRGRWCCAQNPGVGPGMEVAALVLDENMGPSCRSGQHLGERLLSLLVERRKRRGAAGERVPGRPPKA